MSALAEIPLIGHPRFELRQALGEGGFGVVWQAWDRQHEQMVALKVLHRRDASALRRFKTEFRALANLSHEHLVSLFELHQDESRWFFTMELVDGVSFNDWVAPAVRTLGRTPSIALTRPARPTAISRRHLRASSGSASGLEPASTRAAPVEDPQLEAARLADRARALGAAATSPDPAQIPTRHGPKTPLADPDPFFGIEAPDDDTRAVWDATRPRAGFGAGPPLDVARVRAAFRQLVEALAWLHSSGHLHRDVKPSNVLVTRSGELKVLDFGLVTRFWTHDLGAPDPLIGTPVYMAPEVCAGLSASPASDWYSVGVMLYWVLTGYLPFSGPDLQTVVLAKQGLDARPPSEVVSGVPDELDRLCRRLLARNPLERPDAAELLFAFGAYDLGAESLGARPHGALPSFVGRRAEVQALAQVFSEPLLVRSGPDAGPTLALVDGLSGYGKTSLVEHFLRESEGQGCLVLRSRCFERGSVRYKALDGAVDDLARWLASLSKAELDELLPTSPFDRGALARVFPVLPRITEGAHAYGADADPQEVKRRAFMALRHLLHAIARVERVIVAIDDAQWADEDSVAALAELLRPGRGTAGEDDGAEPALGWLVAYRSDEQEASPFLRAFASALVPLVPARRRVSIHVGPLADDEARRLALDLLGPGARPERADAIVAEAQGHPLLIDELARTVGPVVAHASDSPGTLVDLIRTRLAALPESERTLVELVAIAGEPIDTHLIRAATGADQRDLNMLIHDRLLRARPGGRGETVVAWHDRVREAASSLDAATRTARHRVLAETGARVGGVSDFFLHTHWRGAGEPTLAIEHGLRAAQAAERAFAFDQAASVYRAVLELAPTRTPDLVERLADAMKNAGRGIEAGQAYLEAAGLATATPDAARRLEIAAAEQFLFAGGLDEGAAVIKKVLGRIGLKLGRSLVSVMGQLAWGSLRLKLRGLEFTPRAEAETAPEARAVVDTLWSATIGMSLAHPLTSVAIQKRHLRKALELGEPLRVARALGVELAFSGLPGGKDDRVSRNLSERARAVARMVPHPYAETFVTMGDGGTHWLRGHWVEAQRASEAAVEVFETECAGVSWEKDTASFVALSAIYHRGRLPELARRVDLALADAMSRGDRFIETQLRTRFMPILAYAEDRPDEVALELERALSRWTAHGYQVVHLFAWMANVHGHLYAGRPDEAAELFARGTRPLKRSLMLMGQYYRAQFHDLAGRVALARGDVKRAAKAGKRLVAEDMGWTRPMGELLLGMAALAPAARGRAAAASAARAEGLALLERAAEGFRAADMELHRLAVEHALGLAAGPDGEERRQLAAVATGALGVVEPARFLNAFTGCSPLH